MDIASPKICEIGSAKNGWMMYGREEPMVHVVNVWLTGGLKGFSMAHYGWNDEIWCRLLSGFSELLDHIGRTLVIDSVYVDDTPADISPCSSLPCVNGCVR